MATGNLRQWMVALEDLFQSTAIIVHYDKFKFSPKTKLYTVTNNSGLTCVILILRGPSLCQEILKEPTRVTRLVPRPILRYIA